MAVNRDETKNLALGGGELFIKRAGETKFEYFGSTTEYKYTFETETIEHTNSEGNAIVTDLEVVKSKKATVSLVTDSISSKVMALAFGGDVSETLQTDGSVTDEEILAVEAQKVYDLTRHEISNVIVTYDTDQIAVEGEDYSVNYIFGSIEIAKDGALVGLDITVSFDYAATTIYSFGTLNKTSQEVSLMLRSDPQSGKPQQSIAHRVNLTMSGDYSLKSLEEFLSITFTGKILEDRTKPDGERFVTTIAIGS